MCSGCSGNYESDGEDGEMPRQNSGKKRPGNSREESGPDGVGARGISPGLACSAMAEWRLSADEFDVFVGEDRIVEVRRIGRVSPGFRPSGIRVPGNERAGRGFFRHSGQESAKRYGNPGWGSGAELLRFEVADNWRDISGLSVVARLTRVLRRLCQTGADRAR